MLDINSESNKRISNERLKTSKQTSGETLETALAREAEVVGFCAFGITPASGAPKAGERLRQWLAEGYHGDMLWMAERATQRSSPTALWADVRSVIMLGMSYAPKNDLAALAKRSERGRISVYAQGADYHKIVKAALKALARWLVAAAPETALKVFVDTAPVMEKPLAEAAGLGWQGKHSNLVSREHGSWLFLGAIYTTLDLLPSAPLAPSAPSAAAHDLCGSCDACQRACPTQAFPAPYRLDARRCISYLTIEHKGSIPMELRAGIGNHIYGCDDCLAVCPWNKFAQVAHTHRAFLPRGEMVAPSLSDLLQLDETGFRQVFAGSAIKRIGRDRMVRNAAIAAGNSQKPALIAILKPLLDDGSPVVAESACWAIEQLAALPSKEALA